MNEEGGREDMPAHSVTPSKVPSRRRERTRAPSATCLPPPPKPLPRLRPLHNPSRHSRAGGNPGRVGVQTGRIDKKNAIKQQLRKGLGDGDLCVTSNWFVVSLSNHEPAWNTGERRGAEPLCRGRGGVPHRHKRAGGWEELRPPKELRKGPRLRGRVREGAATLAPSPIPDQPLTMDSDKRRVDALSRACSSNLSPSARETERGPRKTRGVKNS